MAGEIKVDPGAATATYDPAGSEVSGNRSAGVGAAGGGMRPTAGVPMSGIESSFNGSVDKTTAVAGQGSQFAGGFQDADKEGAAKVGAAGSNKAGDDEAGRGGGKSGVGGAGSSRPPAPRLSAGDLARLITPYQSAMPIAQTAAPAAAAPAAAQSFPAQLVSAPLSAAQAPMQAFSSMQSPIQQLLQAPGGAALLEQLLSRGNASNGFDGGPASLQLAGNHSSGGGAGGRLHDIARRVLGIPYAWGGGSLSGPSQGISDGGGPADRAGDYRKIGYDCSGLSRYITAQLYGVEIPRSSQQQYAAGMAVSNPVPGDLVFPRSSFGAGGPGHVQIYLGAGQVLEAPSSGQTVKVSALDGNSEFRRYVRLA